MLFVIRYLKLFACIEVFVKAVVVGIDDGEVAINQFPIVFVWLIFVVCLICGCKGTKKIRIFQIISLKSEIIRFFFTFHGHLMLSVIAFVQE